MPPEIKDCIKCPKCGKSEPQVHFLEKGEWCVDCLVIWRERTRMKQKERDQRWYHNNPEKAKAKSKQCRDKLSAERKVYRNAKEGATKRNIPFELKLEDIVIPKHCPVLGMELEPGTRYAPSVDRVDNSRGYVRDNIIIVSQKVNTMKSDATVEELGKVYEFYKKLENDGPAKL